MDEFIKKLIERLEEITEPIRPVGWSRKIEVVETKAVIEIVNQLAEEYNNESVKGDLISRVALIESFCDENCGDRRCTDAMDRCTFIDKVLEQPTACNDGWISCEKKLPPDGEKVLVWYEYFRYGEYNCMFQTYGIGYQFDGHWSGDVSGTKARCIAWQPLPSLPEAYKENEKC